MHSVDVSETASDSKDQTALTEPALPPGRNLYERVRVRFTRLGGVDLELPDREPTREPPEID